MHRCLLFLILILGVPVPAVVTAQETAADEPQVTAEEGKTADDEESEDADPAIDPELDAELDSENYADAEEKDFIPTEDIPADQAIPFPTDI